MLLQINAITLSPAKPFTWASGWKSPIYCDNRKSLSFPSLRNLVIDELVRLANAHFRATELIAGVATAGIPWGAFVADRLQLPFAYVRPKPKDHGLGNQIEGFVEKGASVLVVEDLISTGKSSLQAVEILDKAAVHVMGLISIFNYGFQDANDAFQNRNLPFYSVTDYGQLIKTAVEKQIVSKEDENTLLNWRANPSQWGQKKII